MPSAVVKSAVTDDLFKLAALKRRARRARPFEIHQKHAPRVPVHGLDLDHLGTQLGQHPRRHRCRHCVGDLHDAHAVKQRRPIARHPRRNLHAWNLRFPQFLRLLVSATLASSPRHNYRNDAHYCQCRHWHAPPQR
jgi:hypothetical protein